MSALEFLVVAACVGGAVWYLARRAVRAFSGRACGCGSPSTKGCPAASSLATEIERVAGGVDARR